jgi:hypothetical protein
MVVVNMVLKSVLKLIFEMIEKMSSGFFVDAQ